MHTFHNIIHNNRHDTDQQRRGDLFKMLKSRDELHTSLRPSSAPGYLHRIVGASLSRRGFDGAEAGALAEMERLLECRECCPMDTISSALSMA